MMRGERSAVAPALPPLPAPGARASLIGKRMDRIGSWITWNDPERASATETVPGTLPGRVSFPLNAHEHGEAAAGAVSALVDRGHDHGRRGKSRKR
jgi:hypothetical protein